jgi:hypothetical protein
MSHKLSEEQIEIYYQNIRNIFLDDDDYMVFLDMDDEEDENYLNREVDKIFEKIFGFAR